MSGAAPSTEAILNSPALAPPPGVQANFTNPSNLKAVFLVIIVLNLSIPAIALLIRIYVRVSITRNIGWEDYTSVLAWLGLVAYDVLNALGTYAGSGVDQWNLLVKDVSRVLYIANCAELAYGFTTFITKLSILLLFLRLFAPTNIARNMTFYACHFLLWTNLLFYFISAFITAFSCTPRELIWNKLIPNGRCLDVNSIIVASAIFNIISDFSLLLLPIYSVWSLQLTKKRKIGVSAIFAFGLLSCLASVARLIYCVKLINSPNFSYNIELVALWSGAEISIGVLVGCLPVLPRFVQHFLPRLRQVLHSSHQISLRENLPSNPKTTHIQRNESNSTYHRGGLDDEEGIFPTPPPQTPRLESSLQNDGIVRTVDISTYVYHHVPAHHPLRQGKEWN